MRNGSERSDGWLTFAPPRCASQKAREHKYSARERVFHHTLMANTVAAEADARRQLEVRAAKNKVDADALREQVRKNEETRMLELERKENEGKLMQRQFERAKQEERKALEAKAAHQRLMTAEFVKANERAAARKALQIEKDKRIDRAVLKYQREKAERERLAEEAEAARKRAAELETARLRALQERATDEKVCRRTGHRQSWGVSC